MPKLLEKFHRVRLLSILLFKDILRRRVTILLLFIIPALFNLVILVTTAEHDDPIMFGILSDTNV
ncbi:MAG: hypothetical protein ACE5HI_05355, partial [bacterium]